MQLLRIFGVLLSVLACACSNGAPETPAADPTDATDTSTPDATAGEWQGAVASGFERCSFRACGQTEDWWIATDSASNPCNSATATPGAGSIRPARLSGTLSGLGKYGHLGQYPRELTVKSLLTLGAPGEPACP